jgi:hypothetical protein
LNHELRDNNLQILVIPEVSQGSKTVPADKITNAISFEDIKDGKDIIVITEKGGAEFFYKVDTITRWFAQKDAERHPKTNPGTGLTINDQNQLSRWTALIKATGGKRKTRKAKKSKKRTANYRI